MYGVAIVSASIPSIAKIRSHPDPLSSSLYCAILLAERMSTEERKDVIMVIKSERSLVVMVASMFAYVEAIWIDFANEGTGEGDVSCLDMSSLR